MVIQLIITLGRFPLLLQYLSMHLLPKLTFLTEELLYSASISGACREATQSLSDVECSFCLVFHTGVATVLAHSIVLNFPLLGSLRYENF